MMHQKNSHNIGLYKVLTYHLLDLQRVVDLHDYR